MSETARRKDTRERMFKRYTDAILDGIARTLWVYTYAAWVEESDNAGNPTAEDDDDVPERPPPGGSWDDVAGDTPHAIREQTAVELAELYATVNQVGSVFDLFEAALRADNDNQEVEWSVPDGASEDHRALDQEFLELAEEFGAGLASEAMESGSSWFDHHAEFDLAPARITIHYDGENLSWDGAAGHKEASRAQPRIITETFDVMRSSPHNATLDRVGEAVVETHMMLATAEESAADRAVDFLTERDAVIYSQEGNRWFQTDPMRYRKRTMYETTGTLADHPAYPHREKAEHRSPRNWPRLRTTFELHDFTEAEATEIFGRVMLDYVPCVLVRINSDEREKSAADLEEYPDIVLVDEALEFVRRYGLADNYDTIDYALVWSSGPGAARFLPMPAKYETVTFDGPVFEDDE